MSQHIICTRLLTLLVMLSVISCTQVTATSQPPTLIPSPTSIPPTFEIPSPTVLPTAAPATRAQIDVLCPSVVTELSDKTMVEGQFVLEPLGLDESPYLLDFTTGSRNYLPYTEGYDPGPFRMSPNYQWIAYLTVAKGQTTDNSLLIVTDLNGKIVYQQPMDMSKWFSLDTWLNDHSLMLERSQYLTFPDGSAVLHTPLPVTILDPFTGESRDLNPNLPNLLPFFDPLVFWQVYGKSGTAYDPSITLVAYGSNAQDYRESIVLWDLNEEQELANLPAPANYAPGPAWSPDGSQFITVSWIKPPEPPPSIPTGKEWLSQELFSVSDSGKIERLTYFTDQFQEVSIGGYTWSPDGRQVAFTVSTKPDLESSDPMSNRLAILDIHTKEVTLLCVQSAPTFRVFWFPNGGQILAGVENAEKSQANSTIASETVLIDLVQNVIIKVADDAIPAGWMVAP